MYLASRRVVLQAFQTVRLAFELWRAANDDVGFSTAESKPRRAEGQLVLAL